MIICIFFYVHDWNNVWGRNNAIIIFPSLSLFRNWTQITWLPFFFCLSIWVSQCQDKGIYLHYHANSSEYIVIPPFEMFHFCYSLSQCQLGFFSLSRVERKGYTQMLNKKFSQLILVLKKKHIYIYLFQIWIQNLCTVFYPMFFSPPLPTCLLYYICNLRIALCM